LTAFLLFPLISFARTGPVDGRALIDERTRAVDACMQYEKAIVIQTILFLSGINTLLQVHFGTRLPAVMSGSYTYIYPAVAIILSPRYALVIDPLEVRSATARSRFREDRFCFLCSFFSHRS